MAKSKNRKNNRKNASNQAIWNRARMETCKMIGRTNREIRNEQANGFMWAIVIMLWILHTEFGFGQKRLSVFTKITMEFIGKYMAHADAPDGEYQGLRVADMARALEEECNIKIDLDRGTVETMAVEVEV